MCSCLYLSQKLIDVPLNYCINRIVTGLLGLNVPLDCNLLKRPAEGDSIGVKNKSNSM